MLANIALLAWPLVAVLLFLRYPPDRAIVLTFLGGMLLLPAAFSIPLPGLPNLSRTTVPSLAALACCLVLVRQTQGGSRGAAAAAVDGPARRPGWLPDSRLQRLLIAVMLVQPLITVLTNGTPIVYGPKVLPGLELYDAGSAISAACVTLIPMLLGRRYLSRPEDVRMLLTTMVAAMLLYSVLIVFEIRMSPQLHRMVYGYYPTDFIQTVRNGGFRPMVFMGHGLALALMMAMTILASAALWRMAGGRERLQAAKTAWLSVVLLFSSSLGALLSAAATVPLVLFAKRSLQVTAAAALAAMVLLYPLTRASDVFPTSTITSAIGGARGESLEFRFVNEDILLYKAVQKPFFGWGGWARNRIFDRYGQDRSVTDGTWIITLGVSGTVGFVARFGLLSLPLLMLWRFRNRPDLGQETAALALILAINLLDLIPNSSEWPLTWLIVGMMTGRVELLRAATPAVAGRGRRRQPGRRGRPDPAPNEPETASRPTGTRPEPEPARAAPARARHEPAGPVRPGLGGSARRGGGAPPRRG